MFGLLGSILNIQSESQVANNLSAQAKGHFVDAVRYQTQHAYNQMASQVYKDIKRMQFEEEMKEILSEEKDNI